MSYCRFSSNNWDCDVYVYESGYVGFVTHVASRRIQGMVPKVSRWETVSPEQWIEENKIQDTPPEQHHYISM